MTKGTVKKIEIKKIENPRSRAICFTRRRKALFKKAQQLTSSCGAEVALLVQSETGQFFVHGSPSIDSTVARFLKNNLSNETQINVDQQKNTDTLTIHTEKEKENEKNDHGEIESWKFLLDMNVESLNSEEEITVFKRKLEQLRRKVDSVIKAKETESRNVESVKSLLVIGSKEDQETKPSNEDRETESSNEDQETKSSKLV